jgi:two-component system, chemotaxis family, chemotaxis protein CheY
MARILIIDDDRDIRHPLRLALENAGHDVLEAQDGTEGLKFWVDRGADLVITDVHMPEKDGLEVVRELTALYPAVKIIALSGGDSTGNFNSLSDAKLFGALRTLPKPFRHAELLSAINELLAKA